MKDKRTMWDEVFEFSIAVIILCTVGWAIIAKILTGRKSKLIEWIGA